MRQTIILALLIVSVMVLSGCTQQHNQETVPTNTLEPVIHPTPVVETEPSDSINDKINEFFAKEPVTPTPESVVLRDSVFKNFSNHARLVMLEFDNADDVRTNTISCVSYSMYPTLRCGDILILMKVTDFDQINVDDIISFIKPDKSTRVIHRVTEKHDDYFTTRGDNNKAADPYEVNMSMNVEVLIGVIYSGYKDSPYDTGDISTHASKRLSYSYRW